MVHSLSMPKPPETPTSSPLQPVAARPCQEYLRSLREILAKAAVDVNTFGAGGATPMDRKVGKPGNYEENAIESSPPNTKPSPPPK